MQSITGSAFSICPQVLPAEVLHGFTVALAWGGGCAYCAQLAPPGLESTSQGLFQGKQLLGSGLARAACRMRGRLARGGLPFPVTCCLSLHEALLLSPENVCAPLWLQASTLGQAWA